MNFPDYSGLLEPGPDCSVEGCKRPGRLIKGFCSIHYSRWWRNGTTDLLIPWSPVDHPNQGGIAYAILDTDAIAIVIGRFK